MVEQKEKIWQKTYLKWPLILNCRTVEPLSGNIKKSMRLCERLRPIWDLFKQNGGSLRAVATAAELQHLIKPLAYLYPLIH